MLETIKYCYENKKIISVYNDAENPETCFVGYVAAYNDTELLIAHISSDGYYDGFILVRTEDIFKVDYDDGYSRKVEKLYKLRQQHHADIEAELKDIEALFFSVIDYAKESNYAVYCDFDDDFARGLVKSYDDDILTLEVYDNFGEANGVSVISVDEVRLLAVDTMDEQSLKLLIENE